MVYISNTPKLTKLADPTVDFAFKRIFGTEKYKAAAIGLLNSIIPGKNIRDVSFINVEIPGMTEEGRKAFNRAVKMPSPKWPDVCWASGSPSTSSPRPRASRRNRSRPSDKRPQHRNSH